jgi:Leucine-rich repeat (LRR) protein
MRANTTAYVANEPEIKALSSENKCYQKFGPLFHKLRSNNRLRKSISAEKCYHYPRSYWIFVRDPFQTIAGGETSYSQSSVLYGEPVMSLRMSPRFSLRTLLIVMATAGVLLGMVARVHSRGVRQRQILAAASEVGGAARYDFECDKSRYYAAQRWLAPRIGADYVGQVLHLSYRAHGSPEWRQSIAAATELTSLEQFTACCHEIEQQDIEQFARLPALKQLSLLHVRTLPVLTPLAKLEHLEQFQLCSCNEVTSEKLRPLQQLKKLRVVELGYTDAGDELIPLLASFPALEELHVDGCEVTTAGLAGLRDSRSLRTLYVDDSQIKAKEMLPGVNVLLNQQ